MRNRQNNSETSHDSDPQIGNNLEDEAVLNENFLNRNVLHKAPGKFNISTTRNGFKHDWFNQKQVVRSSHIQLLSSKPERTKYIGRPRTRGVFNGTKVSHPSFKNASQRYRSQSKDSDLLRMQHTKNNMKSINSQKEAKLENDFKGKSLNFVDQKELQDLYILSQPNSPERYSRKTLTAKLFSGQSNAKKIYQSPSSPYPEIPDYSRNINPMKIYNIGTAGSKKIVNGLPHLKNTTMMDETPLCRNKSNTSNVSKSMINGMPKHLFKFMRNVSKDLLETNSKSKLEAQKLETEESNSQDTQE